MEELFYWLVILAFYLFSSYRSRKRKAIPPPLKKEVEDVIPDAPPPQTKSVLDFLNDAFEKMEAEVEEIEIPKPSQSVKKPIKPIDIVSPKVDLQIQDQSLHHVESTFEEHFDATHDISKVDDRHLGLLKSRIKHTRTKYDLSHSKSKIKTLQQKYHSNPLKLGIIMHTIFDQPKAIQ